MTHFHWIIWAFEYSNGDVTEGTVIIDVISDSEEAALRRAKELHLAKHYSVRNIIEHFDGQCK